MKNLKLSALVKTKFLFLISVLLISLGAIQAQTTVTSRINSFQSVTLTLSYHDDGSVTIHRSVFQDTSHSQNQCSNADSYKYFVFNRDGITSGMSDDSLVITIPNDGNKYYKIYFADPSASVAYTTGGSEPMLCCCNNVYSPTNDCTWHDAGGKQWCEGCQCAQCDPCPFTAGRGLLFLKATSLSWEGDL